MRWSSGFGDIKCGWVTVQQHILATLDEASAALAKLRGDTQQIGAIARAAERMINALAAGGTIFSCGNGGSMCDAMHFAEELTGRYRDNRRALRAVSISDPGYISCTANDFGYEYVFSRYLEAHGRKGDVLLGISTSGRSRNVILAAEAARKLGMTVISLTGKPASELARVSDVEVCAVGGAYADRTQELHIKIIHILIELIERKFSPENY